VRVRSKDEQHRMSCRDVTNKVRETQDTLTLTLTLTLLASVIQANNVINNNTFNESPHTRNQGPVMFSLSLSLSPSLPAEHDDVRLEEEENKRLACSRCGMCAIQIQPTTRHHYM
jgi:hypothetical protein